jgi:hypothetical protein
MNYKVEFIKYNKERVVKFYSLDKTIRELMDRLSDLLFKEGYADMTWDDVRLIKIKSRDGETLSKRLPFNPQRRLDAIAMLGGKCSVEGCNATEDLEFDHIDPETKAFNLASNWSRSWDDIVKELNKCQLLCSTHHLEKTLTDRPPFQHGTIYGYRDGGCRCSACREAKAEDNKKAREVRLAKGLPVAKEK